MTMELTRRDALVALSGGAAASTAALLVPDSGDSPDSLDDEAISTLLALAAVVYPPPVTPTTEFVTAYVAGHPKQRQRRISEAIERLDAGSRRYTGSEFAALPEKKRRAILSRMGVDRVQSDPDGSVPERIRYQLVNSLLYALFSSPTGSELVGIENPTGHPGGYESLMRMPENHE
ncbi:MAG: hypothetical protein ACI8TL_001253 [Natronomonas sp.]|jgi:hypothetical protein